MNFLIIFVFFILNLYAGGEFWATQTVNKELDPKWLFALETQARFKEGEDKFYLFYSQYLLLHAAPEGWSLGGGLRTLFIKREGRWQEENLPLVEFGKRFQRERLTLTFRERIQCNLDRNHFLLRSRLMGRIQLTERFSFYLQDELFMRNASRYHENRIGWSIGFSPAKQLFFTFGYMLKSTREQQDNVLRTLVELTF